MEQKKRALHGDWMGCFYWLGGERTEWILSLLPDNTYHQTITRGNESPSRRAGRYVYDEVDDVIEFSSDDGEASVRYSIRDITRMERVNTLLILRWLALASRNLPTMLYRVHHDPHGLLGQRSTQVGTAQPT